MNSTNEIVSAVEPGWSEKITDSLSVSIYQFLTAFEAFLSPEVLSALSKTLATFIFIFAELSLLFLAISFIIGILQAYIPPEKIKKLLSRKRGVFFAALLGSITPFCSCSTIPFLKGLIRAGAGFAGIIVFLLASPLLNPIIIGLFFISFGLKIAVYYFVVAMGFSIIAGVILDKLGFGKYVKPVGVLFSSKPEKLNNACCDSSVEVEHKFSKLDCCSDAKLESLSFNPISVESEKSASCCVKEKEYTAENSFSKNSKIAWKQAVVDFKQAFIFMLLGVLIGSIIYGFVPDSFISQYAGGESPFAIPFAAIIGVPLYVRAEVVIPISIGLVSKGMGMGAVMAFIIGSAGASLTEVILLKSLFKNQIIYAFLITVFTMAVLAGFLMPLIA